MARNKELLRKRNAEIQSLYEKLSQEKEGKIYKYNHEYILFKISERFHITPKTVMAVIKAN